MKKKLTMSLSTGTLPNWVFQLEELKILNIQGNNLGGAVPADLSNLSLQKLLVSQTELEVEYNQLNFLLQNMTELTHLEIGKAFNYFFGFTQLVQSKQCK